MYACARNTGRGTRVLTTSSVAVADPKLANAIAQVPGLSLKLISDSSTQDVYRAIREHMVSLIPDLVPAEMDSTRLGLAHSLSRHKLKFSPDKVDTMIIQSIASLDVLDKQLNTYAMRVKEWYGWHFPELAKILNDNMAYSRVVLKMGFRTNARETDLSGILPEEIEAAVKAAAEISMGTEITDEDLEATSALAEQVVDLTEYVRPSDQIWQFADILLDIAKTLATTSLHACKHLLLT
jgi:nucleolar protein 58